jgi:RNA-directed DNA polymerase
MGLTDDTQRHIQMRLDFSAELTGEAREAHRGKTESSGATRGVERPARTDRLMEEVCERDNLKEALRRVQANKDSAGVDGMTVDALTGYLAQHWPAIRDRLLTGTYEPKPVRRVEIPKPDGGVRKLGIPTVLDRFIQQAVLQVLQRGWDWTFSPHSYGFRPGRSAHQAVAQAQQYIADGYDWVVDLDLEKFFDRVNHDKLMGRIAQRVDDPRLRRLIRAFLNAGVMLSPLLSNVVLDDLDRELEHRGLRFVRYADDCNIYVRTERAGHHMMDRVTRFLTTRLKLTVNASKSAVARPQERTFLGFTFTAAPMAARAIAPKAIRRFKTKVREITRRAKGVSLETTMADLAPYMRGWRNYFGFCETRGTGVPHALGPLATAIGAVATMANTPASSRRATRAGAWSATGRAYGQQRARPVVPRAGQGPFGGALQCVLRFARPPAFDRRSVAQPTRTAVYGPVRNGGVAGVGGQPPPLCRSNAVMPTNIACKSTRLCTLRHGTGLRLDEYTSDRVSDLRQ